jgi:hypothetical protein
MLFHPKNKALLIIALFLLFVGVAVAIRPTGKGGHKDASESSVTPTSTPVSTLAAESKKEGVLVCLPHKDTDGPMTLECAYGLKAGDGTHYALDAKALAPGAITALPTNKPVSVAGRIRSLSEIQGSSLEKYDVQGMIEVATIETM